MNLKARHEGSSYWIIEDVDAGVLVAEGDAHGYTIKETARVFQIMAAAPDLLEALQGLLRVREGQDGFNAAYRAGLAAIAKATGGK